MEKVSKDHTGKNTVLKLRYFDGAGNIIFFTEYQQRNIHEKIITRSFYAAADPKKRNANLSLTL